jgi:glycerol kinase
MAILPDAIASDGDFGLSSADVLGAEVPVRGVLADQQAGLFGQACFPARIGEEHLRHRGVLVVNAGEKVQLAEGLTSSVGLDCQRHHRLRARRRGVPLRPDAVLDERQPRLFASNEEIEYLARLVPDSGGVYVVPAFGGMCAPHWDRDARAAVVGLTLESTTAHVVRAGMDSMAFQTADIIDALEAGGVPVDTLKVDGGAARSDLLCQLTADLSGKVIARPTSLERTALGVHSSRASASASGTASPTSNSLGVRARIHPEDRRRHPRGTPLRDGKRRSTAPCRVVTGTHASQS